MHDKMHADNANDDGSTPACKSRRRKHTNKRSRNSRTKSKLDCINKKTSQNSAAILQEAALQEAAGGGGKLKTNDCISLIALTKEEVKRRSSNVVELTRNTRIPNLHVPCGSSYFQKYELGVNVREGVKTCTDGNTTRLAFSASEMKHQHFIIVAKIGDLNMSEMRYYGTETATKISLEHSYKDRNHEFTDDDYAVLKIVTTYGSPDVFDTNDLVTSRTCRPNSACPGKHFESKGEVCSFGERASYNALPTNGKSFGPCTKSMHISNSN